MQPRLKAASVVIIVFIASFVIAFLTMERKINVYDEGIVLTAALRVAAGDIIHRDFYANYGPAQFYLLSWLFEIFGRAVVVERAYDLLIRSGILAITYAGTILYTRRWVALAATSLCGLWLCAVGFRGYPIYPALLLTLGSTFILAREFMRDIAAWRLFAAGLLTGLSALFRYDIGFYAFAAHLLSMILILWMNVGGSNKIGQNSTVKGALYILGAGLPVFSIILWYWKVDALTSFLHDVLIFPMQYYARTRGLPFPTISSFITGYAGVSFAIYMPLVVCFFAILSLFRQQQFPSINPKLGFSKSVSDRQVVSIIFLTFLVALFYLKGIVRVSVEHFQLAILPAVILLAIVFEVVRGEVKVFRNTVMALAILSVFSASAFEIKKLHSDRTLVVRDLGGFFDAVKDSTVEVGSVEAAAEAHLDSPFLVGEDRSSALRFITQNTLPSQSIFVGLTRHDKVFVNDVSAYFLTNRLPATKWHHLDPGLQTSAKIQSEMISDLESTKPQYVWLESTWDDVNEPNDSAVSSEVRILDDYIANRYQVAQAFGKILILIRKE